MFESGTAFSDSTDGEIIELDAFREIEELKVWKVSTLWETGTSEDKTIAKTQFTEICARLKEILDGLIRNGETIKLVPKVERKTFE